MFLVEDSEVVGFIEILEASALIAGFDTYRNHNLANSMFQPFSLCCCSFTAPEESTLFREKPEGLSGMGKIKSKVCVPHFKILQSV